MKLDKNYSVSFYNSVMDNIGKEESLETILKDIKNGKYKKAIQEIRETNDKKTRNHLKKKLPAFTASGLFKQRKLAGLEKHSGLIQIDFDEIEDYLSVLERLKADPHTFVAFLSPSGNGIKLIVKIYNTPENHLLIFNHLNIYYKSKYNLSIDKSTKDVSRLFFVSYDPDLYVNVEARRYLTTASPELKNSNVIYNETPGFPSVSRENNNVIKHYNFPEEDIEIVIKRIEQKFVDITSGYENWRNIGFVLSYKFGEQGRDLFHRVSRFNSQYNAQECNEQFNACLKSNGSGITDATFFELAKCHGIDINTKKQNQINTQFQSKNNTKELSTVFHEIEDYLSRKYELRHDIILQEIQIRNKGAKAWEPVNEFSLYIELNKKRINAPENKINAILRSDFVSEYNPLKEYFLSLPKWDKDQTDYIHKLCSYVDAKDNEQFEYHFKKWLVRSVKCVFNKYYFNKQAFILVQSEQNSGKSTFCRFLCPKKLSKFMRDELPEGKDGKIALASNFIINLDELANLSKRDVNQLKTNFSLETVKERLPYARKDSILPRIANFVGSTNDFDFLVDSTGSVRWLCFEIKSIDWKYSSEIDIDNVWSQVFALANDTSFDPEMSKEDIKLNELRNQPFYRTSPEYELITRHLYLDTSLNKTTGNFYTPTDILVHINKYASNHRLTAIGIGKSMKKLGFIRQMNADRKAYGYYIKTKVP